MSEAPHPYQLAIDTISEAGGKAGYGQKPYRLLHKLAKAKGVYMHGSQAFIGKTFRISPNKMKKMAKDSLLKYCQEGVLQIPDEFKYNDDKEYRHDGNGDADRNLWKESNRAAEDKNREEPVQYSLNTTKG